MLHLDSSCLRQARFSWRYILLHYLTNTTIVLCCSGPIYRDLWIYLILIIPLQHYLLDNYAHPLLLVIQLYYHHDHIPFLSAAAIFWEMFECLKLCDIYLNVYLKLLCDSGSSNVNSNIYAIKKSVSIISDWSSQNSALPTHVWKNMSWSYHIFQKANQSSPAW